MAAVQQPYNNLKLSFGGATVAPPFDPTIASLAVVPLVEPIRPFANSYPERLPGQHLRRDAPHRHGRRDHGARDGGGVGHDYVTVHTVVGESGQPLTVIEKNPTNLPTDGTSGRAYDATLFEVTALTRLATGMGKTYGIGAIVLTHGESDAGNANYANDLFQFLTDYNADLSAITGQTAKIPMLVSQQNSVPSDTGSVSISALQVWKAGVDHPGDIVCVGPKYQYSYATDSTHVHLGPLEYEKLGEKNGAGLLRAHGAGTRLAAAAADDLRGERQRRDRPLPRSGAAARLGRHACRRRTARSSPSGRWDAGSR